jgi:hypothetical protein
MGRPSEDSLLTMLEGPGLTHNLAQLEPVIPQQQPLIPQQLVSQQQLLHLPIVETPTSQPSMVVAPSSVCHETTTNFIVQEPNYQAGATHFRRSQTDGWASHSSLQGPSHFEPRLNRPTSLQPQEVQNTIPIAFVNPADSNSNTFFQHQTGV